MMVGSGGLCFGGAGGLGTLGVNERLFGGGAMVGGREGQKLLQRPRWIT